MDYTSLGLDDKLRRTKLKTEYVSSLTEDERTDKTRLINNIVTKGTVQTTDGGLAQLNSVTGGTILFTVDPVTGQVTIAGPVIANVTLNLGTANNTAITGSSTLMGTLISSGIISGGTFNNITVGTSRTVGGTFNTPKFETPTFDTSAGSSALNANGQVAIKTHIGTGVWTYRVGGTTYFVTPSGTLLP